MHSFEKKTNMSGPIFFVFVVLSSAYAQNSNFDPQNSYANNIQDSNDYSQNSYVNAQNSLSNAQNNYADAQSYATADASANTQNQYDSVYRPCPNLNPTCIGQYLSSHSSCEIPTSVASEPFYVDRRDLEMPSINVTLRNNDLRYVNILSGVIEEFFVDFTNGYTVLSVDYSNLTIYIRSARYETNRRANIPLVEITPVYVVFPEMAITTVFPSSNTLDLARTRNIGYLPTLKKLESGETGLALRAYSLNKNTSDLESIKSAAPIVNRFYIQNLLCDYGIKPNQLGYSN